MHVAPNGLTHPRLGIAVSRRVSRKAVVRNRIKRQIRESFRIRRQALGEIDYVVVAKTPAADRPGPELRGELERLWSKAQKKCENH